MRKLEKQHSLQVPRKCIAEKNRNAMMPFEETFAGFITGLIRQFTHAGKPRSGELYSSTFRSFMEFRNGKNIFLSDIDSNVMILYEAYLHNVRGITRNSSSCYMRVLRAVYNRAVECEMIIDRHPFKHVYTGVDKTVKRAVGLDCIKRIKELDLTGNPQLAYARDLFMFSFYTRGMSFVDMAYLGKNNIRNSRLVYCRRKTGQQLVVKWEKCMQDIVDRYSQANGKYLLPIITGGDERGRYLSALSSVNKRLKQVGDMAHAEIPLSMYVARHSWATAARNSNVPLAVISEGLGHDSEITTRIYLASLDYSAVDEANRRLIDVIQTSEGS